MAKRQIMNASKMINPQAHDANVLQAEKDRLKNLANAMAQTDHIILDEFALKAAGKIADIVAIEKIRNDSKRIEIVKHNNREATLPQIHHFKEMAEAICRKQMIKVNNSLVRTLGVEGINQQALDRVQGTLDKLRNTVE